MLKKLIVTSLSICAALLLGSCSNISNNIQASGYIVSETFNTEEFTAVYIDGFWSVVFRQAESHSVTVDISDNLLEYLTVEVRHGTLYPSLNTPRGVGVNYDGANHTITIFAPYLSELNLHGFANVSDWDTIYSQEFTLNTSGFTNINIALDVEKLNLDASGSSSIQLSGKADVADITISGFGTVSAFSLQTQDARVEASGSSNINIAVSNYLNATAEGFSNVRYRGNPTVTQRTSGISTVRAED